MNNDIYITFDTIDNNGTNSNSTLLLKFDNNEYFLPNTNSWIKKNIVTPSIYIEYTSLLCKKDIDLVTIHYKKSKYSILLDSKVLINTNNSLSFTGYINLENCLFDIDAIDISSYNIEQPICTASLHTTQLPQIHCIVGQIDIIYDTWYNNGSLLFYSKSKCGNYNSTLLVNSNNAVLFINLSHHNQNYILYSNYRYNLLTNEIGQIDCSKLKLKFDRLNFIEYPLIVPKDFFIDINKLDNEMSIVST